jgi:hypothetical protein
VFFPDSEWVRFDPSPAGDRKELLDFRTQLSQIVDSIYFRWNRWVVDYSILDQVRGFRMIQNRGFQLSREFLVFSGGIRFRVRQILHRPGMPGAVAVIIGLAIIIWALFRKPGAPGESDLSFTLGPEQKLMIRNYLKMLALLRKAGFVRRDAQTAREFAEDVVRETPGLQAVTRMTEMYEQVRFGLKPFQGERGIEFKDALSECKRALRAWM